MSATVLEIIGKDALIRKFKQMSNEMQGQIIDDALVAGGLDIVNDAKEKSPILTGTLRRSIHIGGHTDKTPDFKEGEGYSDLGKREKNVIYIGTNLIYAAIQEFGGVINNAWGKGISVTIPPHAYLRPAFDLNIEKVKKKIADVLKAQIGRFGK
jgi:HK97 gp10 family phage protein